MSEKKWEELAQKLQTENEMLKDEKVEYQFELARLQIVAEESDKPVPFLTGLQSLDTGICVYLISAGTPKPDDQCIYSLYPHEAKRKSRFVGMVYVHPKQTIGTMRKALLDRLKKPNQYMMSFNELSAIAAKLVISY